jgi:hypothetical protein
MKSCNEIHDAFDSRKKFCERKLNFNICWDDSVMVFCERSETKGKCRTISKSTEGN